jgi:hypothetical protein
MPPETPINDPLLRAISVRRRWLTMTVARLGPAAMTEPVLAVLATLAASEACVEDAWTRALLADLTGPAPRD